jgi:ankyrin repeat protein
MDLVLAVYNRDLVATRRSLEAGADPNSINSLGYPLLFSPIIDALRENIEMIELLLEFGALPEIESDIGDTPLSVASRFGHLRIMKLLLDRKVDLSHQDKYGIWKYSASWCGW